MIKSKVLVLYCCLLVWGATKVNAQSGTVASGGDASGSNGSVSYSIGQTDYQTASSGSGIITEGLQQPYEIVVITGMEATGIELSATVYPNPTSDFVTLTIGDSDVKEMSYGLYDIQGKLIFKNTLAEKQTDISLSGLAAGSYLIKVLNNKTEVKVFKIIKNS